MALQVEVVLPETVAQVLRALQLKEVLEGVLEVLGEERWAA